MISKKTYIPAKPRNKKLIGGMIVSSGSTVSGGPQHSHANKPVIDRLTQPNIDVLSKLSLYQTGVEMVQAVDEFGAPIVDEFGAPVMIEKLVPVIDSFGNPVLDLNGDPVMETVAVYAVKSSVSIISEKEITAYGPDGGEEGEGGSYDMLLSWVDYTEEKANWVVSAALSKGLLDRIVALEAGGSGGSNVAWGTLASGYRELTVEGTTYSVAMSIHTHTKSQISDFAHSHAISDVTGLQTALDGKASSSHAHSWSSITSKPSTFTPSAHTHSVSDVTGLQTALDGKASSLHGHAISDVAGLQTSLDGLVTISTAQIITGAKTFSAALTATVKVVTPTLDLGNGWTIVAGTGQLEIRQNGVLKARYTSGGLVESGEITAYS